MRTYKIEPITVNDLTVVQVIIDSHYEKKHSKDISDNLILKLVRMLDGRREVPEAKTNQYSYFATLIEHNKNNIVLSGYLKTMRFILVL